GFFRDLVERVLGELDGAGGITDGRHDVVGFGFAVAEVYRPADRQQVAQRGFEVVARGLRAFLAYFGVDFLEIFLPAIPRLRVEGIQQPRQLFARHLLGEVYDEDDGGAPERQVAQEQWIAQHLLGRALRARSVHHQPLETQHANGDERRGPHHAAGVKEL